MEEAYLPPKRARIKDAVEKLLPQVPRNLVRSLGYWALYSIHQDIVKSGHNPETVARKYVKGYDPEKIRADREREAFRRERARELLRKKDEARKKQVQLRAQAAAARARARATQEAARIRGRAARKRPS